MRELKAWIRQHLARLLFSLRMTLGALASFGLGEAFGLTQAYWAVLSAIIVMQGTVGGSFKAGINRLIGTIGGAVWGAAVAFIVPHDGAKALAFALFVAVAPLALLTAFRPDYRVAPITAIIVLMGASLQQADPFTSAISRVFEISLGSAVAIAVALLIVPARAHRLLARSGGAAVASMADAVSLLGSAAGGGFDHETLSRVQGRMRAMIAQTESRAAEASVERVNHLSDGPDPEPLPRTLRRLRHDLAMLARVLQTPFTAPVRNRLQEPIEALCGALSQWLSWTSKALAGAAMPPALDDVEVTVGRFKLAVANAAQEGITYEAGNEDTQRIFALLFLFEQMLQNLKDLSDRTSELCGSPPSPKAGKI